MAYNHFKSTRTGELTVYLNMIFVFAGGMRAVTHGLQASIYFGHPACYSNAMAQAQTGKSMQLS